MIGFAHDGYETRCAPIPGLSTSIRFLRLTPVPCVRAMMTLWSGLHAMPTKLASSGAFSRWTPAIDAKDEAIERGKVRPSCRWPSSARLQVTTVFYSRNGTPQRDALCVRLPRRTPSAWSRSN